MAPETTDMAALVAAKPKVALLATRQVRKLRDEVLGKEKQLYSESQQTEKMANYCCQEPS